MGSLKWEHFTHGADIGIRGNGESIEEAFEMAAIALSAVVTDPEKVSASTNVHVHCDENDVELLFLDWINAVIYEMDTRRMIFSKYNVQIKDGRLEGELSGETVDFKKHDPAVDIKGATMTELKVSKKNVEWTAQCVVDV